MFQKHNDYIPSFNINEFKFELISIKDRYDMFRYTVSCRGFGMVFLLVGFDVTRFCNHISNVDFVHFVWDNYRRFSFKKYAINVIPTSTTMPRMLCLQYYRAKSDGWKDNGNCDDCVMENKLALLPLTDCRLDDCSCTICARQPPSLAHLANHVLLNYTLSLKRFTLNEDTTYQQYVYACRSPHVLISNRLPPEYPTIRLWFRCEQDSHFRSHRDCPGSGGWDSTMEREYESYEGILSDLIRFKDQFWCHHCERGLFVPKN
jgi:hypothetical protein